METVYKVVLIIQCNLENIVLIVIPLVLAVLETHSLVMNVEMDIINLKTDAIDNVLTDFTLTTQGVYADNVMLDAQPVEVLDNA